MSDQWNPDASPLVRDGVEWVDHDDQRHQWSSPEAWSEAWWSEWRALKPLLEANSDQASPTPAVDCLAEAATRGHGHATLLLVATLAEGALSDEDFSDLGAGDLETVLVHRDCPDDDLSEVEQLARERPKLAEALSYMWIGEDLPEPRRSRLLRLGAIDRTKPLPR